MSENPQPVRDAYTFVMEQIQGGVRPPNLLTCFDCIIPRLAAYPLSFSFVLMAGEDCDTGEDFWLASFEDDTRPETRVGRSRHETVEGAIILAAAEALAALGQTECASNQGIWRDVNI